MGCPKHALRHRKSGESLLHFQCRRWGDWLAGERFVVGLQEPRALPGWKLLSDPPAWKGHGPLAAILAALQSSRAPWLAILPVDAPGFEPQLFEQAFLNAGSAQWITFADREGREQWLCSLIKRELAESLRQALDSGQRAVHRTARACKVQVIPWRKAWPENTFCNLNSPEQLGEWTKPWVASAPPSEKTSSQAPQ